MGQVCSWGIIKTRRLWAISAWIFEITMKAEYQKKVSLDFITKTYISLGLMKETGWNLSIRDPDHVATIGQMYDIHAVRSVSAQLIPACQAKLLMQIALLADRAVSVVKNPGKAQDTEWNEIASRSLLLPHVSHLKFRCLVQAAQVGHRQKGAFLESDYFLDSCFKMELFTLWTLKHLRQQV